MDGKPTNITLWLGQNQRKKLKNTTIRLIRSVHSRIASVLDSVEASSPCASLHLQDRGGTREIPSAQGGAHRLLLRWGRIRAHWRWLRWTDPSERMDNRLRWRAHPWRVRAHASATTATTSMVVVSGPMTTASDSTHADLLGQQLLRLGSTCSSSLV